jgi:hypothetical protein
MVALSVYIARFTALPEKLWWRVPFVVWDRSLMHIVAAYRAKDNNAFEPASLH